MKDMTVTLTDEQRALKAAVHDLCKQFRPEYWRELDAKREYPEAFVNALTKAGYLAALIPQEYGAPGRGGEEGSLILEEINHSGGNAAACHAQMYIMGTLLRHGSEAQKKQYLPKIATGELRLQAFGVTEPNSGSDTTKLQTTAVRKGERYAVNGQKIFISRVLQSDLMLLLARTTPVDQLKKKTDGLSVFLVDIRNIKGLEVRPLRMMMNHSTNALFFDNMELEPPDRMRIKAPRLFDGGEPCGPEANMAKYLAAEAAWEAANACIDCHGGYGYAEEYDVERKFREARLYKTAPINNNLILAYVGEHVLGMPRSY